MIERKNDWFATQLNLQNRPEVTEFDLYSNGITPDNTGIREKDYYRSVPQVQQAFEKNGKFDEQAFNNFYESALRTYNEYANSRFVQKILDSFGTSPYDITLVSNPNQYVIQTGTVLTNFHDRNRHSYGTGNLWEMGEPNFSDREVAQTKKVRDAEGNELDWTPNDKGGLIKGLFRPSIVLASYDEDTDEMMNGRLVHHVKGELKLDEDGDPYPELLGDRDPYGKQLLKYSDTITIEGTKLNNWDPFDSDGLDKSIGSTIAKTTLTLAPFFIPTVGPILGGIAALAGIASALPIVAKSIDSIITHNDEDDFARSMTKIEAYMDRFGNALSDKGRSNFMSFENIGNIISTSAGQLFSQRVIGDVPGKIARLLNSNAKTTKLGQQLSLGYMAMTSSTETYGAFKQAGASDQLAGIGMLATIAGFWGLMNTGYFKNKLFEGSLLDENTQVARTLSEINLTTGRSLFGPNFKEFTFKPNGLWDRALKSDSKIAQFLATSIKKTIDWGKKLPVGKAGGMENAFFSRSINESIEEWMEEVMQDSVKGLAKGFEALGFNVTDDGIDKLDFGINPEEMMKRWAASLIGGAIGGATFELFNQVDLVLKPELRRLQQLPAWQRLAYDLQDPDMKARYDARIAKMIKSGNAGNRNLSAIDYTPVKDSKGEKGTKRAYAQGTESDNQNKTMGSVLQYLINQTYDVLHSEGLIHNNPNLILQAIASPKVKEMIEKSGLSAEDWWKNNSFDAVLTALYEIGAFDIVVQHARTLGQDIYNTKTEMKNYRQRIANELGIEKQDELESQIKKHEEYKILEKKLEKFQNEYKDIVSGNLADDYIGYAYFTLGDSAFKYYPKLFNSTVKNGESLGFTTVENFAKVMYDGLDYNSLKEDSPIKERIDTEFENFQKKNSDSYWRVWQFHKTVSDNFTQDLLKADSMLKKAKSDKFHDYRTVGGYLSSAKAAVENLTKSLEGIRAKLVETYGKDVTEAELNANPDYAKLLKELQDYEAIVNFYSHFGLDTSLDQVFKMQELREEFGENFLPQAQLTPEQKISAEQKTRLYYNYLKTNNVISRSKSSQLQYLQKYLQLRGDKLAVELWNSLINTSLEHGVSKAVFQEMFPDAVGLEAQPDILDESALTELVFQNEEYLSQFFEGLAPGDYMVEIQERAKTKAFGELLKDNSFIEDLDNLVTLVRSNPVAAVEKYNELVQRLQPVMDKINKIIAVHPHTKGKVLTAEELVNRLAFAGDNVVPFVSEMLSIVDNLKQSPTFDILNKLSVTLTGENNKILDLIRSQRETLSNLTDLTTFSLNSSMKKALEDAQILLNIFTAIVDSAQNNLNSKVNEYRQSLNKPLMAEISENTKQIMLDDIEFIQNQIEYLKSLGGMNLEKRTNQQKDIMQFDTVQRIKFFVDTPSEYEPIVKSVAKEVFGDEDFFSTLFGNKEILNDVTPEKFKEVYKAILKFENALYDHFNTKISDKLGAFGKIFELFLIDPSTKSQNAGLLTDDPNNKVTVYGMLRYLMINLLTKAQDVQAIYKGAVEDSTFTPFYSQELIIRDAWAFVHNTEIYNLLVNKTKEWLKNDKSKFVSESEALSNLFFVNGVPGSGKTTVIANMIKKMLRFEDGNDTDTEFISVSITSEQTKKLAEAIGEPNSAINWDVLLNNITDQAGTKTIATGRDATGHQTLDNFKPKSDRKAISKTDAKRIVMFFDEITLAQEADLLKLKAYVNEIISKDPSLKVSIIGLGDLNQSSASVLDDKNNEWEVSLTNLLYNSSFRLTTSLRETNQGKQDNTQMIFNVIDVAQQKFYANRNYSLASSASNEESANKDIANALAVPKVLKWYEAPNAVYGDKYINRSQINDTVKKLLSFPNSANQTIAIVVTDDADTEQYKELYRENPNVKVLTKTQAQGGEFTYVIADAKLNDNLFLKIKEFYTLMSRATNATFFTTENSSIDGITMSAEPNSEAGIILKSDNDAEQAKIYEKYRAWRLDLIDDITVPEKGKTGTSAAEPTPPPTSGSSSSGSTSTFEEPKKHTQEELKKMAIETLSSEPELVNSEDDENMTRRRKRSGKESTNYISIEDGDADMEVFSEWLTKIDPTKLGRAITPNSANTTVEQTNRYRSYIAYVSSAILSKDVENLELITENFTEYRDITTVIENAFKHPNENVYYYVTPIDNGRSLIYFCFNDGKKAYAIPITIINGTNKGKIALNDFNPKIEVKPIFVSSRGKHFGKLSDIAGYKVSVSNYLGSFINQPGIPVKGKKFTRGKTYAIISNTLNQSIEGYTQLPQQILDFLKPSFENATIEWTVNRSLPFRIIGVQNLVDFQTLQQICEWIRTANSSKGGQITEAKIIDAGKKLTDFFGIDYIPYKNKGLFIDENIASEDEVKSTNIRLLSGDTRLAFINLFNRYFEDSNFLDIYANAYQVKKGKAPIFKLIRKVSDDKPLIIKYIKYKGENEYVLIDVNGREGNTFKAAPLNLSTTVKKFFYGSEGVFTKALEELSKYDPSDPLWNESAESLYNKDEIWADYAVEWLENNEYRIYDFNINTIVNIIGEIKKGNNSSQDNVDGFARTLASSEQFKHGIYLNIVADKYLNSKDGNNDAIWGVNRIIPGWNLVSDICYIFAPIYSIGINTTIQNIPELDSTNSSNDANIQSKSKTYTVNGSEYIFTDLIANLDWVIDNVVPGEEEIPTNTNEFKITKIDIVDNWVYLKKGNRTSKFKLKDDFDISSIISGFDANTKDIPIADNLVVFKDKLYIKDEKSGERVGVNIIGANSSTIYYTTRKSKELQSTKFGESSRKNISKFIDPIIAEKGTMLGYYEDMPVFAQNTNGIDSYYIYDGTNKTELDYKAGHLVGGDIDIDLSSEQEINNNRNTYLDTNITRVEDIKNKILSSITDNISRIINPAELSEKLKTLNSVEEVTNTINKILYDNRFMFGEILFFDENGVLATKSSLDVKIGHVVWNDFLKDVANNSIELPKSISIDIDENNKHRYTLTIEYSDGRIEQSNEAWFEKNGTIDRISLEEVNLDQAVEIFLDDIRSILQRYPDLAQEFSEINDAIINWASSNGKDTSDLMRSLLDKIIEDDRFDTAIDSCDLVQSKFEC